MKPNITTIFRRKSLLLSVVAAMSTLPGQFAQAAEDVDAQLEEITVTGSRIRQTSGMVTPVPITAVTMEELASYEPDSTIAEQLDQLPQFFQTSSAQRGGVITGSSGGSFLNMRGIGSNRTLILLDGSRVVPNDRTGVVNVDVFPTALVRNVEVVTGGASAAYGADALAGVVNFILDREFEGFKTSVSTGITEQGDGQNWNASVAGGLQVGDRLHLIGSLEGRRIHQIDRNMSAESGQWDSFQRWGHVTNPAWQAASALPVGDPNRCVAATRCAAGPQRLTLPDVHSTVSTPTGLINLPAAGTTPASALNRLTFLEDGSGVRPFVNGDVFLANPTAGLQSQSGGPEAYLSDVSFNVGPFGNEVQQEALFTGFKFDATDRFNIHGDLIISNTESNTHDQPGIPHLQGGQANWQATIYSGNPFLPPSVQAIMTAENRPFIRIDKLGQPMGIADFDSYESQHNQFSTWTANAGFDFDLDGNWQLSGYYQSGETDRTTIIYNETRIDRLFMAIDAVRDANGGIVCNVQKVNPTAAQLAAAVAGRTFNGQQTTPITRISPVGGDNAIRDCVPLNILGVGQSSQAARDYVHDDRIAHTNVQQDFAELVLDGELFEGFGAGPVSVAGGLTWRDSSFKQYYETTSGDPLDGPPVNAENLGIRGIPAGYTVSTSMFMFGGVPNISGEYDVWEAFAELNVPVWESSSGNQRLEFNFAGRNSDYSRSGEIVSWKAGTSFQVSEDLRFRGTLSHDVREPSFSELFDQQGTAASIQDAAFTPAKSQQLTIVNGGNPDLSPEEADTTTIGVVYQPSFGNFLDGFQVSLDWYEIDIEGLIASLGAQRLVDDCLKGSTLACGYVERDATTNDVLRVSNIFLNINAATVSGVDAEVVYRMEPDFFKSEAESFSVRGLIGYMSENSQTNLGAAKLEQAGGPGRPEWSSTITATYGLGAFDVMLRANYFDSVLVNSMWTQGVEVDDNVTASSTVWNAGLGYNGETSSGSTWRANFNVTNLFDREPPIIASFSTRFGSQTVSNDYDVFGRRYQLSFNYNF